MLFIVCGPRKTGSTVDLMRSFEVSLHKNKNTFSFSYLFLADESLNRCYGCAACITKGELFCPNIKTLSHIEAAIREADGVVIGFPIYSMHIPSLMKQWIDGFSYIIHRPRFFGKKAMILTTAGGGAFVAQDAIKYTKEILREWGFEVVDAFATVSLSLLPESQRLKSQDILEKKAKKLSDALMYPSHRSPSLFSLFWFNMWKLQAKTGEKNNTPDYRYWKNQNWFSQNYYYSVRLNVFHMFFIFIIKALLGEVGKRMYRT